MKIIRHLLVICTLIFPSYGFAAPGELDFGFNPDASGGDYVLAMAVQPDGKIAIGGSFTMVGNSEHRNIARINEDGTLDANFHPGADANSHVTCLAVQGDGKILVGGIFTSMNGEARNGIARLNADGTLESTATFNPGTGLDGVVYAVALQTDGKILVGGIFTSVDGQPRNGIARLHPDGTVEDTATFNPGTGVVDDPVSSVVVQADGKILVVGYFTSVNGQPRNRIARLHADGTLEDTSTFNPGTGANEPVSNVVVQADGKILLGGFFSSVNGLPRNAIARLNADGTVEGTATFNPGTGPSSDGIITLAVQADGKILIGGFFTSVNGQQGNAIARLNADGTVEHAAAFHPVTGTDGGVYAAALQADGGILLGGHFTDVNGVRRNGIARLTNNAARQSLTIPGTTRVQWLRGGAAPEVEQVTFEFSADNGVSWSALGVGTRIPNGWERTGISLPASGRVRARGRSSGGFENSSYGLIEQTTQPFTFGTPFTTWKIAELADAAAPDLGDTDFDGLVHLAEYALNLSPTAPSLPPPAERHLYAEGERLRMFFTRDPARNDVTLEVQSAESPAGPWTTVAASTLGGVTTGPGYVGGDAASPGLKTVEVRDTVNISPTTASRYLRVKVTH